VTFCENAQNRSKQAKMTKYAVFAQFYSNNAKRYYFQGIIFPEKRILLPKKLLNIHFR